MNAEGWLEILDDGKSYGAESDPFSEDENLYANCVWTSEYGRDYVPPSTTEAKKFLPNKKIFELNQSLEERTPKLQVKEEHRKDLIKLKQASADKYAYARGELLGMLENYNSS